MSTVQSILPVKKQGAFWHEFDGALTDQYPDTGRGGNTSTAGNALWEDLGIVAGTFEVVIEAIVLDTGATSCVITELHADASTNTIVRNPACPLNIPMRDGFKVTTVGNGVYIQFRIHRYMSTS